MRDFLTELMKLTYTKKQTKNLTKKSILIWEEIVHNAYRTNVSFHNIFVFLHNFLLEGCLTAGKKYNDYRTKMDRSGDQTRSD